MYIYSSVHISLAATLFAAETYFFVCQEIDLFYLGLVFCSTLFVYSLHRIIGITKVESKHIDGRYKIILKYKSHLKVYGTIALAGIIYFLLSSSIKYLYFLVPLGIVSVLYTLPILSNNKRLRDFNYIKIFLIAIVWAGIAVGHITIGDNPISYFLLSILFIEKIIYIVAITLPFDVRDIEIDRSLTTKTIPQSLDVSKTYLLIYALMTVGLFLYLLVCYYDNQYGVIPYVIMAYALSVLSVYVSKDKHSDYYYSGLLDGVIGLRSVILIFGFLA